MAGSTLPERVAQIYYTYGLFCSSYPITAITLAISFVLLSCYPLLNVPLPGNIPTVVKLPVLNSYDNKSVEHAFKVADCNSSECLHKDYSHLDLNILKNETQKLPYLWAKEKPRLYVQQIILKTGVSPWNSNLGMWDAFRAPLQEVFRLLETIRNHEDPEIKTSLGRHCYHIDHIKKRDSKASKERVLPEYNCLLLSPANLWQQNLQTFSLDSNIINTIFSYQNLHSGKVSIAEMAFGMHLKDAGIKKYPLRSRPRVLQYAITIFYRKADERFILSLMTKLKQMYPLYQDTSNSVEDATLIYYPGEFNYLELVPLTITFIGIFLYVYFSVRKIEFIKSKFGLAACAVLTIAGSLSMSVGLCFYFGFSLSLHGKEIYPYLIIIVGLENVLVLTKSVTSTDSRLDVKIRLAQGLSKEGWSITKNLLTEITIFTLSLFTFVPFIQEFSIFMIFSLLSDYFIQMVFFATILGIDVRRMEYFQEQNTRLNFKEYFTWNNALNWRYNKYQPDERQSPQTMTKSKSHPRLNGLAQASPTDVVAKRKNSPSHNEHRVPKRIRLVNMWARTRFFQRAFMLWMLVWISMIIYNSGVVDYFVNSSEKSETESNKKHYDRNEVQQPVYDFHNHSATESIVFSSLVDYNSNDKLNVDVNETIMLKHSQHMRPWARLPSHHWSTILSQYNESVTGGYIVVLPPQLLSYRISPELAISVRNPDEKDPAPLRWQALAAALDPIDISIPDFELLDHKAPTHQWGKAMTASELPIYPTTPMEILLLAILCGISVTVIAYMMVVLYRCVCSRNYAEWRASWNAKNEDSLRMIGKQPAVQLVMEAVPLVVSGHSHEVECLVTDAEKVVSSCLQGTIKIWDPQNGELLNKIDRHSYFKFHRMLNEKVNLKKVNICNNSQVTQHSDKEESKKPSETIYSLRKRLKNHLTNIRFRGTSKEPSLQVSSAEKTRYDFAKSYRDLYCSEPNFEVYNYCHEAKENIDINNKQSKTPVKTNAKIRHDLATTNGTENCNEDVLIFNVNRNKSNMENLRNRYKNENSLNYNEDLNKDSIEVENEINYESNLDWKEKVISESPIWCMDYCNDLIILGCADGRLEFWESTSGKLMCVWWGGGGGGRVGRGVTQVRAVSGARRVCAASLAGHLLLLRIDAYNAVSGAQVDWRFSTAHRRTHKRTGSAGSIKMSRYNNSDERCNSTRAYADCSRLSYDENSHISGSEELQCTRLAYCRPHQQPITEMHSEGGRILTGGQDHILKVFSSMDLSQLFTLHGHCGPITSCFIDHFTPTIGGSGSQDGLLCVWDLHTGACLYSMQAHDGAVTSLAYTASYVISAGSDERLCIWDRFQGHMLNSIHIGLNYMSRMLPLTHTLLLMGDRGGLTVYDLSNGDVIRRVLLGQNDGCIFVRQILPLKDAIVCDYANQLRIVRFPLVSKLSDMKSD